MNRIEATRIEYATAIMIPLEIKDIMAQHHEEEDVKAATRAVLLTAIDMISSNAMQPLEELFDDQ